MVVQVATIHQVQYEAQLIRGVEGVGHAHDEGTVVASGHQAQHDPLIQSQGFPLLHLDPLLVQALKWNWVLVSLTASTTSTPEL